MSRNAPLRAVVVGAGPTAEQLHLPVLAALRDRGALVLACICDLRADRTEAAQRRFGFERASGDAFAALARDDVDLIYIFGDAALHHRLGLEALTRGKHLFVEKPIAPDYRQAMELAQAAAARGLIAAGGHNRRFYPSLLEARARGGHAGWRYAEAVFHKPELGRPPPFGAETWLGANGIHALDALVHMMGGLPDQLMSAAAPCGGVEAAAFSALMRWRDGAQASFLCNNAAGARREEYVFHAPGLTVTATDTAVTVASEGKVASTATSGFGESVAAEHAAFIDAVRTGAPPVHAIANLAPSLFLAELIEAGFSGPVRLPVARAAAAAVEPAPADAAVILVSNAAALQPALGRRFVGRPLVSIDEVAADPRPRPEIVAAVLGRGAEPLTDDVLDKLPGLRVVGVMGLSVARIEPEALLARGVMIVNASSAYAETVADFALGLAILGRRRAFTSHAVMRAGGWGVVPPPAGLGQMVRRLAGPIRPWARRAGLERALLGAWRRAQPVVDGSAASAPGAACDLKGATIGLIGWGANARAFASRLRGLGAHVLVHSTHAAADELEAAGVRPAALGEVLAADVVSLHRGLTPATRHGLGAAELERLRPGTVLINVARGALIEPRALLARLRRGDIFACLDTFEDEPPARRDPLRRLPNVFLTAHIAGGSPDMHRAAAEEVVGKVADYLEGRPVDAVTRERLGSMT